MAETNPTPPENTLRSPLWMRALLIGSLGLNLLVAGMVTASLLMGGGPGPSREAARDLERTPFVRALAPEDRRMLLRDLRRERESLRENRQMLRQRFESLLATLRADELDRTALDTIVTEQREATEARQRLGERLVIGRIVAMSVQERRAYADRLEAAVRRPRQ